MNSLMTMITAICTVVSIWNIRRNKKLNLILQAIIIVAYIVAVLFIGLSGDIFQILNFILIFMFCFVFIEMIKNYKNNSSDKKDDK